MKKVGDMPLELTYKAMEHGPVPMEIYNNRDNPSYFSKIVFEPIQTKSGKSMYLVKPKGTFDSDYFADAELKEMNELIDIFAKRWVGATEMSEASHQEIKAWKKTYSRQPNDNIDPIEEFDRDITALPEDSLQTEELKYLMHRKIMELAV